MKKIEVEDPLKTLDQICEPHDRQKYFLTSLSNNHKVLSSITLNDSVSIDAKQLFETAKNLSLYSWYVYRFHQAAELMGFSALEMALRERYCAENPIDLDKKRKKKIMLHDLIKHAEKRWLVNNTFPSLHSLGKNIETQYKLFESHAGKEAAEVLQGLVKDSIVACSAHSIRNDLAHGSKTLHPNSIATLSMIAEFINQIYS